jgi:hypothetical protein
MQNKITSEKLLELIAKEKQRREEAKRIFREKWSLLAADFKQKSER